MDRYGDALVPADLGNGQVIQVAVSSVAVNTAAAADPESDVSILTRLRSSEQPPSFDGVTSSIEAIAQKVTDALSNVGPEKATVEFGIDVGVETGGLTGLLVKGTGSATLRITLEWSRESGERSN